MLNQHEKQADQIETPYVSPYVAEAARRAKQDDIVRVLRVIEYIGPRDWVEKTVANSIQGVRRMPFARAEIRAATIGAYPEVLANLPADTCDCVPYTEGKL